MSSDMVPPIELDERGDGHAGLNDVPPRGVHIIRLPHDMSDRELLEECVQNQRTLIQQIAEVTATFGTIHEQVAAGGIGGLVKALMGRS